MAVEKDIELIIKKIRKEKLERSLTKTEVQEIGSLALTEMKTRIAKGISPITGDRFQAYLNPKRYPGKKKPQRPVNLFLSGDFLQSLKMTAAGGKNAFIRIFFSDKLSIKKERGHREGAGGQPRRPIIPQGGESFSEGITLALKRKLREIISKALAK